MKTTTIKRVTGEARFQPSGESGWIDLGWIEAHRFMPEIGRKSVKRSTPGGLLMIAREEVIEASPIWAIELLEESLENLELQLLGRAEADYVQVGGGGQIVLASIRPRRIYELGALRVSNVYAELDGDPLVLGEDYSLDAEAGTIRILEGGRINEGDTIVVDYEAPAISRNTVRPLAQPARRGRLKIYESDADAGDFRAIISFACDLSPEGWGENSPLDVTQWKLRAVAVGPIDYTIRAQTTPAPDYLLFATGDGPQYIAVTGGSYLAIAA